MFIDKMKSRLGALQEKTRLKLFTKTKNQPSISIFQNLKQINILLWNEIIESQNVKLLDVNYTDSFKYSKDELKELNEKFIEFYDAYFLALNNPHAKREIKETQKKVYLSAKIMILYDCANSLLSIKRNYNFIKNPLLKEEEVYKCVKLISKNAKFGKFNTIEENLDIINKLIVSNETTFKREYGETEKEQEEKRYSFEKQVVDVEQVLGRSLDVEKTNVIKWVGYLNLATEISKKRQENGGNKK